jgi:hypothetical protein
MIEGSKNVRYASAVGGGRGVRNVHSAGQCILGRGINEVKCLVKIFVFVHVDLLNPTRQHGDRREDK